MAVIKCNECNGTVSTLASACPHCGAPVLQLKTPQQPLPPPPSVPRTPVPASQKNKNEETIAATPNPVKRKNYIKYVVGIGAGYIGLKIATEVVFTHLFEARFPHANFGSFVRAINQCKDHSILFFALAYVGGTISCGLARKPTVGILAGLATGALVGVLSGFIYFYNHYNY
jgi:hypothetical protein